MKAKEKELALEDKQEQAANWFYCLQAMICEEFTLTLPHASSG